MPMRRKRVVKKAKKAKRLRRVRKRMGAVTEAYALLHVLGRERTLVLASVRGSETLVQSLSSAYGLHLNGRYRIVKVTVTEL